MGAPAGRIQPEPGRMTFDPSSQVLVWLQRQIAIANMGVNEFVVERPRVSSNPLNVVSPGSLVAE